ncbi:MAG: tRNA (adenosine(37)-N6)-threonylcarbamoyltransferase complex dimerization subunit type 1 TsaB [Hyphomicrobiales bacterium]
MAKILCIETATQICSVAIGVDGKVVSLRENTRKNSHSEMITLYIQEVLDEAGINVQDLDAIAVSKGPGSYTGLRIGVSTVKGLAYSLEKPVIAISTLQSMAQSMASEYDENTLLCPMIDARRMEVYCAMYDSGNNQVSNIEAKIIDEDSFVDILEKQKVVFFGDGAEKCKEVFESKSNAIFTEKGLPSAVPMVDIAERLYAKEQFEDVAYFEPYYLKDFVAGKPKVKGLR